MKRIFSLILVLLMLVTAFAADTKENAPNGTPPAPPDGAMGTPPDGMGTPPDGTGTPPDGMGTPPDGGMGDPDGASRVESYDAVRSYDEDIAISGETIRSEAKDENAILVTDGAVSVSESTVTRRSEESAGGDSASFYGVGAAILTLGGSVTVENSVIETDAAGGAGVFAFGDGVAYVKNSTITTKQGASGGIHVAGGGTLYAENLTVTTDGASSAAIRSDRGGGTMTVVGGAYTANGSGSPAVYVTADISISNADLTATGSEALCLEGKNAVRLTDCDLSGNMPDQEQNDTTWTVIVYQSMSGDAQIGEGTFAMEGGTLASGNGGVFYTTNTDSRFTLKNVQIQPCEDSEFLLRCTGNQNARGWGRSGSNGANCSFLAIRQNLPGDVIYDSISNLTLALTEGSVLTGAVVNDESCAGDGGSGVCELTIDATSAWIVTGDSRVSSLKNAGTLTDAEGHSVTVIGADGTIYEQGDSPWTVTVGEYNVVE